MNIIHENAKNNKNDELVIESRNVRKNGEKKRFRIVYIGDLIIIMLLITLVVMICIKF